jgi:hypothetical protein
MQIANATTEARKKPIENEQKKINSPASIKKHLLFVSFMDQISILIFLLMHFRVTGEVIGTAPSRTYSNSTHKKTFTNYTL